MEQESPTTFLAQLTERMAIDGAPPRRRVGVCVHMYTCGCVYM